MLLFSLEGIDGAGKTTQCYILENWLKNEGYNVISCKDPGSTKLGKILRNIILKNKNLKICPESQVFMFAAAKRQLVDEIIKPNIKNDCIILTDRYYLSGIVYQGYGMNLNINRLKTIYHISIDAIYPNFTFVLDLPVESAFKRMKNKKLDNIELYDRKIFEKIRNGFIEESKNHFPPTKIINGNKNIDEIFEDIKGSILKILNK
ncbi:MAG: dTMP kinase [Candidatus Pacearchaeota archaeon]